MDRKLPDTATPPDVKAVPVPVQPPLQPQVPESGGPKGAKTGAEPTRYGDWEQNGRCTDF